VVLTRGCPVTRVGVIHPIESYWLCRGPFVESFEELDFRERAFADLTNWLLEGLVDFDFISESLLPNQIWQPAQNCSHDQQKTLTVGACDYETVVIPNLKTIRRSTLEILRKFASSGGKVIIAGDSPTFLDAMVSQYPTSDLEIPGSLSIPFTRTDVLQAVEDQRDLL